MRPAGISPVDARVAVIKACLYEPQVNRTYAEMAAHYDTAILPAARPRRPHDKAKVEVAVLIIERWLLGRVRHRRLYAGRTVELTDGSTDEVRPAQIFVAVMGASNYTHAEATLTQSLPDWIGAHVPALAFMGGVPAQLVV